MTDTARRRIGRPPSGIPHKVRTMIVLRPNVAQAIKERAGVENRSLSGMIEYTLLSYLRSVGAPIPPLVSEDKVNSDTRENVS